MIVDHKMQNFIFQLSSVGFLGQVENLKALVTSTQIVCFHLKTKTHNALMKGSNEKQNTEDTISKFGILKDMVKGLKLGSKISYLEYLRKVFFEKFNFSIYCSCQDGVQLPKILSWRLQPFLRYIF